jgi:hypothetical protein
MAHIRKRESGRWQATVRLRDGSRRSRTFGRRREAEQWAACAHQAVYDGEPFSSVLPVSRQVNDAIRRILAGRDHSGVPDSVSSAGRQALPFRELDIHLNGVPSRPRSSARRSPRKPRTRLPSPGRRPDDIPRPRHRQAQRGPRL